MVIRLLIAVLVVGLVAGDALAQIGRRYEIKVEDGKLVAQGYIGGVGSGDDGGGLVRPYTGAIHHHWRNDPSEPIATADLPGMDVLTPGELEGYSLKFTVLGGKKWDMPPDDPAPGTAIEWEALDLGETIYVLLDGQVASTAQGGTVVVAEDIGAGGAPDVGISYLVGMQPEDVVMAVEGVFHTDAPGVEASDAVYLFFAPAFGAKHLTALYVEAEMGDPIPCEGDANGDGVVDVVDVVHVLFRFGAGCGTP